MNCTPAEVECRRTRVRVAFAPNNLETHPSTVQKAPILLWVGPPSWSGRLLGRGDLDDSVGQAAEVLPGSHRSNADVRLPGRPQLPTDVCHVLCVSTNARRVIG